MMNKPGFWNEYNARRIKSNPSQFDMLFEAIMTGCQLPEIKAKNNGFSPASSHRAALILEDIQRPMYVISESTGRQILLEDALFWSEEQLISEGIVQAVVDKAKELFNKIKEGLQNILKESSEAIRNFCEKVKNNKIVVKIREKLGLDKLMPEGAFKKFVTVKDAKGKEVKGQAAEAVERMLNSRSIISEAGLTEKEFALSPEDLQKKIELYQNVLDGKKKLRRHGGDVYDMSKPEDKTRIEGKLSAFKKRLEDVSKKNDTSSESGVEATDSSAKKSNEESSAKVDKKESVGSATIDEEAIKNRCEEAVKTACPEGEDKDEGSEEAPADGEKKQSLADKAGNWIKGKIQKVGEWFSKKNPWVKRLIKLVLAVLAVVAIIFLFVHIIMPIFAVILHGGIVTAGGAVFTLISSGKTFHATYKAGQSAWKTGTGWGKFFMMLAMSVMAYFALSKVAEMGRGIQKARAAQSQSESSGKAETSQKGSGSSKEITDPSERKAIIEKWKNKPPSPERTAALKKAEVDFPDDPQDIQDELRECNLKIKAGGRQPRIN